MLTSAAQAIGLYAESFDYGPTDGLVRDGAAGTWASGSGVVRYEAEGGLAHPALSNTTGGAIRHDHPTGVRGASDPSIGLDYTVYAPGDAVWFAALLCVSNLTAASSVSFNGGNVNSVAFGVTVDGEATVSASRNLGSVQTAVIASNVVAGGTHLFVARVTKGTTANPEDSTVHFWFDPSDLSSTGALGAAQLVFADSKAGRHSDVIGSVDADLSPYGRFDEVRVGTTLAAIRTGLGDGEPALRALPADMVMNTSARLRADLTSTGTATTTVRAYWGTTDGGADPAAWDHQALVSPQAPTGLVTWAVTGLVEFTSYVYRFGASNEVATAWSLREAFETFGGPTNVYDGFHTAPSGADYVAGSTILGTSPATQGFQGTDTWSGPASADHDARTLDGSLRYEGMVAARDGRLVLSRSASSGAHAVSRNLRYRMDDTNDFYLAVLIDLASGATASLMLLDDDRSSRIDLTDDGAGQRTIQTAFAGATATQYAAPLPGTGPHALVLRVISRGRENYDDYELWVDPTVSRESTGLLADLGPPVATGQAILRNLAGESTPTAFTALRIEATLDAGEWIAVDEWHVARNPADFIAIAPPQGTVLLVR